MGKRENQRKEFDTLKQMFPTDHTQLSVISARVDEVQIQFKGKNTGGYGGKYLPLA